MAHRCAEEAGRVGLWTVKFSSPTFSVKCEKTVISGRCEKYARFQTQFFAGGDAQVPKTSGNVLRDGQTKSGHALSWSLFKSVGIKIKIVCEL